MTHSLKTNLTLRLNLRWIFAAVTLAAIILPGAANAGIARAGGAYDGTWNVVFATTRGNCSSGYSVTCDHAAPGAGTWQATRG
jgi:hypothetical protein